MKIFKAVLGKKSGEIAENRNTDVMRIPNIIEPLINQAAYDIVTAHRDRLLHEQITYIVPAIWGAKKDGKLDKTQEEIFRKVEPIINQIIKSFEFQNLHMTQVFGVAYLVKGLIVSKITYMLELLKNRMAQEVQISHQNMEKLETMEPIGRA